MLTYAAVALVGIGIGVLSGLLGVGGGTIMVPTFRLVFGLSAIQSTATSLFTIIPTSVAGCITHIRNRTCVVPVGVAAGLGGASTSALGAYLASVSPSWAVMLAAGAVIAFSAYKMLFKAFRMKGPRAAAKGAAAEGDAAKAPAAPATAFHASPALFAKGFLIGLIAGVLSGYVGVGGGFIMVPLFISVLGIEIHKASGTSLLAIMILAIPGTVEQFLLGNVIVAVGLACAAGSIPGAIFGARLSKRVPERTLRIVFGALLLVAAVALVINELAL